MFDGSRRKRAPHALWLVAALFVALALALGSVLPAQAVHDQFSTFDLTNADTGHVRGPATGKFDWKDFFAPQGGTPGNTGVPSPVLPAPSRPDYVTSTFIRDYGLDARATADATTFATGSHDTLDITPGWQCNFDNNVNDKIDLVNVYALAYVIPSTYTPPSPSAVNRPGDLVIYAALERFSNDGNANVAFWLLQDPNVGCTTTNGAAAFTGNHKHGDLLIVAAFTKGGNVSGITIYEWVIDSAGSRLNQTPIFDGGLNAADCRTSGLTDDLACGSSNQVGPPEELVKPPWFTIDKDGDNILNHGEFFEMGLNVSAATRRAEGRDDAQAPCVAKILADTRSSQSLTATLFDYALGDFDTCKLGAHKYLDVNGNGQKDAGEAGLAGWTMTLYRDVDNSGTLTPGDTQVDQQTTDANGNVTFSGVTQGNFVVCETLLSGTPPWVNSDPGTGAPICKAVSIKAGDRKVVQFGNGQPAIAVTKTCTADVFVGDKIQYTITVTNTGNVNLNNVGLADKLLGPLPTVGTLTPGQSQTFTPTQVATATGAVNNTVTATGTYGSTTSFATVRDSKDCTTQVHELTVTKTATPTWVQTFDWDITKEVTPASAEIFENDRQDLDYTITVTKKVASNDFAVSGTITITNPAPIEAKLASVSDETQDVNASVSCGTLTVAANSTLTCSYRATGLRSPNGTNTATVTKGNGTTVTGSVTYSLSAPTTKVNDTASVSDVQSLTSGLNLVDCRGACSWSWPQTVSDSTTFTYTKTVGSAAKGTYTVDDTATVTFGSTSKEAKKSVTVVVRDLSVTKTATPTWERTFDWTVTKSVNPTSLTLKPGESGTLTYTVQATRSLVSETFGVSGQITVRNNNASKAAIITGLADIVADIADGVRARVSCGEAGEASFPITIPASGNLVCTYTASGLPGAAGTNTATATNQNRRFDARGTASATLGTTSYSGSASYKLTAPTSEIDETAEVKESETCPAGFTCVEDFTNSGTLPPWTFNDSGSKTFTKRVTAGAGVACNSKAELPNTVTLTELDTRQTSSSSAGVVITVPPCGGTFPTQTTCQDFLTPGTAEENLGQYSVRSGVINQVNPGVIFYYTLFQAPSPSFTVNIEQSRDLLGNHSKIELFGVQQVQIFEANCTTSSRGTVRSTSGGQVTIDFSGATTGQPFIVAVKYSLGTVKDDPAPDPTTVRYDFATKIGGTTVDFDATGFKLEKK